MLQLSLAIAMGLFAVAVLVPAALWLLGFCYVPHNRVAIIEKKWSERGSLQGGCIIALRGEAGFQAKILRGGIHFGLYPFKYALHRQRLITVAEGRIGYVYARDGEPLPPTQTLGRVVDCVSFQDAEAFLQKAGQRGRQRAILREGVYAINTALFVVITEDAGSPAKPRLTSTIRNCEALSSSPLTDMSRCSRFPWSSTSTTSVHPA
jgi:uncharacterized membrane protein YqiK